MPLKSWGLAFHGRLDDGTLTLPNGSTMAYPRPPDGSCALVKFPTTPPVPLTTAEKDSLALTGKEFLSYALIAGTNQQGHIAGKSINADFIYQSPNGKRWAVRGDWYFVGANMNNDLTGTLTFTRFGDFKLSDTFTPEVYTASFTLINAGQSSPVITSYDLSETLATGFVGLESFKPDGTECILRIEGAFQTASPEKTYPASVIGFVKLGISGDETGFTVTPSIYHDRATTLGDYSETQTVASSETYAWSHIEGDWATGTQYRESDSVAVDVFTGASTDISSSTANRIMAVQYDDAGVLHNLVFNASASESYTYDPFTNSGSSISQSTSSTSSYNASLSWNGKNITISGSGFSSETNTYTGSGSNATFSGTRTSSYSAQGFSGTENITPSGTAGNIPAVNSIFIGGGGFSPIINGSNRRLTNQTNMFSHFTGWSASISGNGLVSFVANDVHRWTPQLYGFYGSITRYTTFPATDTKILYSQIISNKAKDSATSEVAIGDETPFACAHPVTGEIIWKSATPVNFI